jgi:hypothetical protein
MKATSVALDHLLRAVGDPLADLRSIGPGHPEFERAQSLRAGIGVLAKSPDALPAIARVLQTTDRAAVSPRKRAHLAAAEAWLSGDPVFAAESYAHILDLWPRDLLALRLAQSCYFFAGWHQRFCAVVDAAMLAWKREERDFGYVLAMASFAHAENGDADYAEALGRQALAVDPACPIGVHAVAHAIAESGRQGDGARWMRQQREQWHTESRMCTHNAWHLAMFDAEDGNLASALGILDEWLLPGSEESPIEACDATGLLWRLQAKGADDEGRWLRISDAFERGLTPGFWPFVDLHAGLAHLAAGKAARVHRLVEAIERCADGDDYAASRARSVTFPGLRALIARAEGRHAEAAGLFADLLPSLGKAGGSSVQLEIFKSFTPQPSSTKEHLEWKRRALTSDRAFAER